VRFELTKVVDYVIFSEVVTIYQIRVHAKDAEHHRGSEQAGLALATVFAAEASRTVQAEADQLAGEIEAAWQDADLPPLAAQLDPSRYLFLQDRVARTAQHLDDMRANLTAAEARAESTPSDDPAQPAIIPAARKLLADAELAAETAAGSSCASSRPAERQLRGGDSPRYRRRRPRL
jgi:hypothetical protein